MIKWFAALLERLFSSHTGVGRPVIEKEVPPAIKTPDTSIPWRRQSIPHYPSDIAATPHYENGKLSQVRRRPDVVQPVQSMPPRRVDDEFDGSGILAAVILANAIHGHDYTPTPPIIEGKGGTFGGAGANGSWDEPDKKEVEPARFDTSVFAAAALALSDRGLAESAREEREPVCRADDPPPSESSSSSE